VEQPVGSGASQAPSITNTSGPSPPSPMPPLPQSEQPVPGLAPQAAHPPNTPQVSHSAPPPSHNPSFTPQSSSTPGPPQAPHNGGLTPQVSRPGTVTPPPPMPAGQHHQGQATIPENSSPPIPERNNIRNRLELDSVSPAVQRPNPMETPISPITPGSPSNKANFSYPSRAPPQGTPRQVLAGHLQPTPEQWGQAWNSQQHQPQMPQAGYDEASRPIPFRAGHNAQQPQGVPQKQPTLANLKAAAHGIHVGLNLCHCHEEVLLRYHRVLAKLSAEPSTPLSTDVSLPPTLPYTRKTKLSSMQGALRLMGNSSHTDTVLVQLQLMRPRSHPCLLPQERRHMWVHRYLARSSKEARVAEAGS
jgi:hypothetical protein